MAAGGLGYDDLNQLMKSPEDLEFVFELLSLETEYEKESWQMDADEKLDSVPQLKLEGNNLFKVLLLFLCSLSSLNMILIYIQAPFLCKSS